MKQWPVKLNVVHHTCTFQLNQSGRNRPGCVTEYSLEHENVTSCILCIGDQHTHGATTVKGGAEVCTGSRSPSHE